MVDTGRTPIRINPSPPIDHSHADGSEVLWGFPQYDEVRVLWVCMICDERFVRRVFDWTSLRYPVKP